MLRACLESSDLSEKVDNRAKICEGVRRILGIFNKRLRKFYPVSRFCSKSVGFKQALMVRPVMLTVVLAVAAICLSSCATSTASELAKGKRDFISQRYDLSYMHVNQAAHAGDPDAQYALGYMYYYGKGVPQNYRSANYWIAKAAAQGQPLALQAQKQLFKTGQEAVNNTKPAKVYGSQTLVKQRIDQKAVVFHKIIKSKNGAEQKLLAIPKTHYTIQLLGSSSSRDAINYIRRHRLSRATIYCTHHNGRSWFVVVDGNFTNAHTAEIALRCLSKAVKRCKPWVKSMSIVHREINR